MSCSLVKTCPPCVIITALTYAYFRLLFWPSIDVFVCDGTKYIVAFRDWYPRIYIVPAVHKLLSVTVSYLFCIKWSSAGAPSPRRVSLLLSQSEFVWQDVRHTELPDGGVSWILHKSDATYLWLLPFIMSRWTLYSYYTVHIFRMIIYIELISIIYLHMTRHYLKKLKI